MNELESKELLNKYGISYNSKDENELVLSFCYAMEDGNPLVWDDEVLESVLGWFITDSYKEFISEDDESIIYFLKGVEYTKRLTNAFTGLIDITFKALSPFGYKYTKDIILPNENYVEIYNYSNSDNKYKPLITITEIYIDGEMGTIQDSENNNLINNSNRKWIELCKGVNEISIEGICTLIIESYYPMMV